MSGTSSSIDYGELRRRPIHAPQTFAQALFSKSWRPRRLAGHSEAENATEAKGVEQEEVTPPTATAAVSEREQLMEALDQFVTDKGVESDRELEVSFAGGKLTKPMGSDFVIEIDRLEESLKSELEICDDLVDKTLLFVCDKPSDWEDREPGQDLLSKMIDAMKLGPCYARVFFNKESQRTRESWEMLMTMLGQQKSITVVSMGAFTTNMVLRKKERLSKIHGKPIVQRYQWPDGEREVTIFPVFHPDILRINPNMKRSAWLDLQVVMKHLQPLS